MSENTTPTTARATPTSTEPETFRLTEGQTTEPAPATEPTAEKPAGKGKGGKGSKPAAGKGKGSKPEPKSAAELADTIKKKQEEAATRKTEDALLKGWAPSQATQHPVKSLVCDRRFQMRATGSDTFHEDTVEDYKDKMKDGETFPPVKVVKITEEEAKKYKLAGTMIVWDGFHTIEAAKRAGFKEFPAEVMDGTFRFARVLACGSNRTHGLTRSDSDKRRTLLTVVDDPELLEDAKILARNSGSETGGLTRALAFVCGVSIGHVSKTLASKGLATRGDKIIRKPTADTTGGTGTTGGTTTAPEPTANGHAPAANGQMPAQSQQEIAATATGAILGQMQKLIASLEMRVESLLTRPVAGDLFREMTKNYGIPIAKAQSVGTGGSIDSRAATVENTEHWPALVKIKTVCEEVGRQFAASQTIPADENKTPEPATAGK